MQHVVTACLLAQCQTPAVASRDMRVNPPTEQWLATDRVWLDAGTGIRLAFADESAVILWPWHQDEADVQAALGAAEALGYDTFAQWGDGIDLDGVEHCFTVALRGQA